MGLPEDLVRKQSRADACYLKMGAVPLGSCLPYRTGNLPLPGSHFSWGGSAGATFSKSVLSARGNREGMPATIAGVTPEYSLHLRENRLSNKAFFKNKKGRTFIALPFHPPPAFFSG